MSVLEHARGGTRAPVGRALNIKSRFDHFDALPMVVGDKELVKAVVAAAFSGADPSRGVRVALSSQRWRDALTGGRFKRVLLTGQGKASVEMAVAAVAALRDAPGVPALAGGLVLTKYDHGSSEASAALESAGVRVLRGGHPLPDEAGCAGTQELLSLAQQHATEDTIVVNLVSGGGSSLYVALKKRVALEDFLRGSFCLNVHPSLTHHLLRMRTSEGRLFRRRACRWQKCRRQSRCFSRAGPRLRSSTPCGGTSRASRAGALPRASSRRR